METKDDRRHRKLKELCAKHGLDEVADKSGVSSASLSQILKGVLLPPKRDGTRSPRNLGDKAASAIEEGLSLGRGWFDQDNALPASSAPGPSLAELIKRFSNEIQAAPPDVQALVALAFAEWGKAPHRWERLVSQLERLNIGPGSANQEPRYAVGKTDDGQDAIRVQPNALLVVKEISLLPESIQADQILEELHDALEESKYRHGLHKWPFHNSRYTDKPVETDRRVNIEDSPPMTTAGRMELHESSGRDQLPTK